MNLTIDQINALKREEVEKMPHELINVKGYDIFLVDLGGHFGFSRLVYWKENQIRHANDYELHHNGRAKDELKELYIRAANNKLFTDEELDTVENYEDYNAKMEYLLNHYAYRVPNISAFVIIRTKEDEKEFKKKIRGMSYDPIGMCYMNDKEFIKEHIALEERLRKAKKKMEESYEYMRSAFLYEMYNHEYAINLQGDWDVLSCFSDIELPFHEGDINKYFDLLSFNDTKRKAYLDARRECLEKSA